MMTMLWPAALFAGGGLADMLCAGCAAQRLKRRTWLRRCRRLLRAVLGPLAYVALALLLLPAGLALYALGLALLTAWLVLWAYPAALLFHTFWMLLGCGMLPKAVSRRMNNALYRKQATSKQREWVASSGRSLSSPKVRPPPCAVSLPPPAAALNLNSLHAYHLRNRGGAFHI